MKDGLSEGAGPEDADNPTSARQAWLGGDIPPFGEPGEGGRSCWGILDHAQAGWYETDRSLQLLPILHENEHILLPAESSASVGKRPNTQKSFGAHEMQL